MNKTEYTNLHRWISQQKGKATKCENPECKSKAPKRFEWALKAGHAYEQKTENFIELCPSCHRKYDMTEAKIKKLQEPRKTKVHQEPIKMLSIAGQVFSSTKDAAEKLGINRRSIYNVLAGKAQRVGGFTVTKL